MARPLAAMSPFERLLRALIVRGKRPTGHDTLVELGALSNTAATGARVRVARERPKRAGVLAKPGRAWRVENALFAEHRAALDLRRMI